MDINIMDIKRNINQRNKIFRKSAAFTNKIDVNFENVDKLIEAEAKWVSLLHRREW